MRARARRWTERLKFQTRKGSQIGPRGHVLRRWRTTVRQGRRGGRDPKGVRCVLLPACRGIPGLCAQSANVMTVGRAAADGGDRSDKLENRLRVRNKTTRQTGTVPRDLNCSPESRGLLVATTSEVVTNRPSACDTFDKRTEK